MTFIQAVSWVLVASIGTGCTSTSILTQSEVRIDKDRDITVYTDDGRIIRFNSGDYKIIEENFGSIRGKGKLYIERSETKFREFEGTVTFAEVREISESDTSAVGYAGLIAGGTIVLLLIALAKIGVAPPH